MCTGVNWKWGVRICSKMVSGHQRWVKEKSVVPALSTLAVQLECRFFSLLLVFLFGWGNLLECRMQSEKAVGSCLEHADDGPAETHVRQPQRVKMHVHLWNEILSP